MKSLLKLISLVSLCAACRPQPIVTSVDLSFPVVVIFASGSWSLHRDPVDLSLMRMQPVIMAESAPRLIDNEFNVYSVDKLKSTKNSLEILASGGFGMTKVTFELRRLSQVDKQSAKQLLSAFDSSTSSAAEQTEYDLAVTNAQNLAELFPANGTIARE